MRLNFFIGVFFIFLNGITLTHGIVEILKIYTSVTEMQITIFKFIMMAICVSIPPLLINFYSTTSIESIGSPFTKAVYYLFSAIVQVPLSFVLTLALYLILFH